ncbi:MAG: hypothetical protein DRJ60_05525 [Thermoprotei archaeon]|nr:MAG: hypothetical protein DRJ60_05525 [Thermoprotei archaeon]
MRSWVYVTLTIVVIAVIAGAFFIPSLMPPPVSAEEIKYLGTEKIDGSDCYVILVKSNVKNLISYLESVMGSKFTEDLA